MATIKAFSNTELSAFCGQMSLILKSGISSMEGIQIMLEDARNVDEKEILTLISDKMMETGYFYQSLEEANVFPDYMIRMVEIGEETGTLDEVMDALQVHYEREESIFQNIKSAVTYPMIMIGMMVVVILVLLVKVMPIFNQVFIQLGTEMTGFSKILMDVGTVISRYSVALVVLFVVILGILFFGTRSQKGKQTLISLGYRIPFTRAIFENIAACRFASGLALTLSSGLNPERSLELVVSLNTDPLFQKKLDQCMDILSQEDNLPDALHKANIFTGIYARLASVGSKTGSLDLAMKKIATLYQEEIDNRTNNVLSILEPTMVVVLSLIVGVILLSVMLPLTGIMSSI